MPSGLEIFRDHFKDYTDSCAIIGGIANSFLDTGIYPAVAEIINKAPGVATMGIKFAISGSQLLLPFFLGIAVGQTAGGLVSYNTLFYAVGICYLVLMGLILFFRYLRDGDYHPGRKIENIYQIWIRLDQLLHVMLCAEDLISDQIPCVALDSGICFHANATLPRFF